MTEIPLRPQRRRGSIGRRALLGGTVAATAALGLLAANRLTGAYETEPRKYPPATFLDLAPDGSSYVVVDQPKAVPIIFETFEPVGLYQRPTYDAKPAGISKSTMKARYGIRVLGGSYPREPKTNIPIENFSPKDRYGKEYPSGGLWFLLSDARGNLVNEHGNPVTDPNKAVYVIGNQVTVVRSQPQGSLKT